MLTSSCANAKFCIVSSVSSKCVAPEQAVNEAVGMTGGIGGGVIVVVIAVFVILLVWM